MTIPTSYESAGLQLARTASRSVRPPPARWASTGKIPVVIRPYSSAVHATSGYVSSASFGATQLAIVVEIANTLVGLGIWATV
jgi:hypothetical protein